MIKFITKGSRGASGIRNLEFDINITINKDSRKEGTFESVRIGLRNNSIARFKTKLVALAYDADQEIIYIIPDTTLADDVKDSAKLYTICDNHKAGYHVKSSSKELMDFVKEHKFTGFHHLTYDAKTGWFMIKALTSPRFV